MIRYADPSSCPDCRAPLRGAQKCPSCGLDLTGDLGQKLFTTLAVADTLLEQLRDRSAGPGHARVHAGVPAPTPAPAPAPDASRPGVVRPSAVPKILLSVGAVCILVAALIFLAVTWSVLGVGGRTAVLVGLTAAMAALTWWTSRQGFRGAVEALGLVTLGLFTLDLGGARAADWFGDPSFSGFVLATSVVLAALGMAATHVLRRTPAGGFTVGELTAVAAGLAAFSVVGSWEVGEFVVRLLALVVGLGVVAVLARRLDLRITGVGLGVLSALAWVTLFAESVGYASDAGGDLAFGRLWGDLRVWPLLVTAALPVPVAAGPSVPMPARVAAANLATVTLVTAVALPGLDEPGTTGVLALVFTVLGVSLLAATAAQRARRPWSAAGLLTLGAGILWLCAESVVWVAEAAEGYARTAGAAWDGTPSGPVRTDGSILALQGAAPWLLPITVATIGLAGVAAARTSERGRSIEPRLVAVLLGAATTLAAAATTLNYALPVWVLLASLLLVAALATVFGLDEERSGLVALAAGCLVIAQPLSWYDEVLTVTALSITLVLLGVVHGLAKNLLVSLGAGVALGPAVAGLAVSLGAVLGVDRPWAALAGMLVLAGTVLTRWLLPGEEPVVTAVEVGCAMAAPALLVLGAAAAADHAATWVSVYLTLLGATATVMALLRPDRREAAWAGGLLLAMATWFRLADIGVSEPEPYTLPSAVALLVVGGYALRRRPSLSTPAALGTGLTLALVPSLLWVLEDASGPRAIILGVACLGLMIAGAQVRWSAPLLWGALVGLVVVLREAGPYLGDAVPRWAALGAAGALLVMVALTWERRLADARRALNYAQDLR